MEAVLTRLFQLHQLPEDLKEKIIYKALNSIYQSRRRNSDPPYLLKTIRNCFQNPIRNLWVSTKCGMDRYFVIL